MTNPKLKSPELNKIYTIRDIEYFPEVDRYGIWLEEIRNEPITSTNNGVTRIIEMPFSPQYFRPAIKAELLQTISVNA